MKFIVDAHLPKSLARLLVTLGYNRWEYAKQPIIGSFFS